MKTYLHYNSLSVIFLTFVFVPFILALTGCEDTPVYRPADEQGDGTIHMSLSFQPLYAVDATPTRTIGSAIKNINSLSIVVFDSKGQLSRIYNQGDEDILDLKIAQSGNLSMPEGSSGSQAEAATPRATLKLANVQFGNYKFYAVANMGLITPEMASDEATLKSTVLTWDPNDVASNNQMFGYFSTDNPDRMPTNFDAPVIKVGLQTQNLHSWVRRAASKVTIAYNGSGLKDNVRIHIYKATIRDIPSQCHLGEINTPNEDYSPLIPEGGSLYYDEHGVIEDSNASDVTDGLTITNKLKTPVGSDHSETAQALFFYENMQGDYENDPNKDFYDKRQDKSPQMGVLVDPGDPDYKDECKYGTYIEVEGYYESDNPENLSSGKIIYRFMLGKDEKYNYNAERNHHYKLTLVFKGWANQADWHIEYTQEDPSIVTPDYFYMPYLYNQKAMFPIKLNGNVKSLDVEIVENGWAPVTLDTHEVPAQKVGDFQWNLPAYEKFGPKANQYPQLGFLALAVPNETGLPEKNVVNLDYKQEETATNELKVAYTEERTAPGGYKWSQCKRQYDISPGPHQEGNNEYIVTPADEGKSMTVQIPLWTRNKSMIENSGYSGNNPYEYYERKAVIKITAIFTVDGIDEPRTAEVPIYQVRRIVNPKAVWRSSTNNDDFFVHLMTLNSPNDTKYEQLKNKGTWTATIENGDKSFCYLTDENGSKMTTVKGDTDSEIKFYIKFNNSVAEGSSKGCIVNIVYNGGSCTHKILVRQGYNEDVPIVGSTPLWSSYNLFSCESGRNNSSIPAVNASVTVNPLAIGSLFKRRNYEQAILIENNVDYGPLMPLYGNSLKIAQKNNDNTWKEANWNSITAYRTDNSDTGFPWATFNVTPNGSQTSRVYRVPTYDEFKALDNAEYAIGVVYADGAGETKDEFSAYGFNDPNNDKYSAKEGVRGFIVYNPTTGNQILFPLGQFGMARRTQFNLGEFDGFASNAQNNPRRGFLRYADVSSPLTSTGDLWRPIPYDLPSCPGAIYWINIPVANGHSEGIPCGGWDLNYFSLDFSPYTYNNRYDACPIKLVR